MHQRWMTHRTGDHDQLAVGGVEDSRAQGKHGSEIEADFHRGKRGANIE